MWSTIVVSLSRARRDQGKEESTCSAGIKQRQTLDQVVLTKDLVDLVVQVSPACLCRSIVAGSVATGVTRCIKIRRQIRFVCHAEAEFAILNCCQPAMHEERKNNCGDQDKRRFVNKQNCTKSADSLVSAQKAAVPTAIRADAVRDALEPRSGEEPRRSGEHPILQVLFVAAELVCITRRKQHFVRTPCSSHITGNREPTLLTLEQDFIFKDSFRLPSSRLRSSAKHRPDNPESRSDAPQSTRTHP